MRVRFVAIAVVLLVASCGGETRTGLEAGQADIDAPRVGCPNGPFFPLASLDALPPLIEESSVPDVAEAIAPFLESGEGNFWPKDGWRVVEVVENERVQLVHPGSPDSQAVAFMSADWTGDTWRWSGSSIPNDCVLVIEPSAGELPEPLGQRELRDARATDLGELRLILQRLIDGEDGESSEITMEGEVEDRTAATEGLDGGDCDPALVVDTVDRAVASARLRPAGAAWTAPAGSVFASQTTAPEEFAAVLGFDCSWVGMQTVGGDERYAVAAWTGDRIGAVIQATDQPDPPYSEDRTVDLLVAAPRGELVDTDTWAAKGPDGQTIILLTRKVDVLGLVAKSWIAGEGLASSTDGTTAGQEIGTATDQLAIPALQAAGGRNVGLAEPSHGSPVSLYYLVSSTGDSIFVTVGPEDVFDPIAPLPSGATSDRDLGLGDPVRFVDPTEPYPTTAAGFVCNGYGWAVEAESGDIEEASEFIADLMTSLGCT